MRRLFALLITAALTAPLSAQETQSGLVSPVCVQGIGECRNVAGLRLSLRDRNLERVTGMNVSVWMPHKPTTGTIKGFAIGLPSTGSEYISGIAVAPALLTARTRISGIAVAGLGTAANGEARGAAVSGIATVVGEGLTGIAVSGVGVAAGGDASGIIASGVGTVVAGEMTGIALGGLGVILNGGGAGLAGAVFGGAVNGPFTGITVGGLGFAGGGSITGITIAGLGAAVGESMRGLTVAGLAVGAGQSIDGIAIAGLGIAAPRISRLAIATGVGTGDASGIVIAPLYFRAQRDDGNGRARGAFVSAVNDIRGDLSGVSIGVINFARSLSGVQIGLLNIVADGRSPRVLPIVNWR